LTGVDAYCIVVASTSIDTKETVMKALPVVVIGAGPQGLAAAAHLLERGLTPLVLEAGSGPAHAVSEWSHVRLFSGWPELIDTAAARLLQSTGWSAPATGYPTGEEWISGYLRPLAAALGDHVRYGSAVTGVSRRGRDRLVDAGRAEQPFSVHLIDQTGLESRVDARAVIDASGTWAQPNPAGADGLPALGEAAAAEGLTYRLPDLSDPAQAESFAGRQVVVVGRGRRRRSGRHGHRIPRRTGTRHYRWGGPDLRRWPLPRPGRPGRRPDRLSP
jgi:cation diffusion facilitator CzcD-associated flavoprotein CzcO